MDGFEKEYRIMKRIGKLSYLIFCAVFIITAFSGCGFLNGEQGFRFSSVGKDAVSVTAEEILSYTPSRPDAVGDYLKGKLTESELYIYNAVSYAVDNGYTDISIPSQYGSSAPESYTKAITFYSCDSPFLEHNYTHDGTFRLSENTSAAGSTYSFTLPRNSTIFTNEKKLAYEKAKELVDNLPSTLTTDKQKTEYLYDYVCKNISYVEAVNSYRYDTVPIYDALIEGKETICDGFADTLMLLLNLAGIDCFAVEGVNEKNAGHVVICAKIDGQYFYLDPTNDSNIYQNGFKPGFYYALSDSQLSAYFKAEEDFSSLLPSCPVSRTKEKADVIAAGDDEASVNNAKSILLRDGAVNVCFDDNVSDSDKQSFGRKLATAYGSSLLNTSANGITGYTK